MSKKSSGEHHALERDDSLPFAVPVQIQCDSFRCLAYRDKEGNWVDFHTGKLIVGTIRVVEHELPE